MSSYPVTFAIDAAAWGRGEGGAGTDGGGVSFDAGAEKRGRPDVDRIPRHARPGTHLEPREPSREAREVDDEALAREREVGDDHHDGRVIVSACGD
jgi:hypothetical protein